jgi:exodeoxyribonuclease VII small subunit
MAKEEKMDLGKLSFEDAIKELTQIVDKIESGQVPLQTSIEHYEKGMALVKHCRGILQAAEKKIEKVSQQGQEENKK